MKTQLRIENNLKQLRIDSGLSQPAVAKALGFATYERISLWENGRAYPSVANLLKLAKLFDVLAEEIYELHD